MIHASAISTTDSPNRAGSTGGIGARPRCRGCFVSPRIPTQSEAEMARESHPEDGECPADIIP